MTSQQHPDWCLTKQLDSIIYPSWHVKLTITIGLMKPRLLCLIYNMWCPVVARPDAGKDWRQEEKRDDRGRDGSMALTARWTWVWASSRSWWWIGKPGVQKAMGSQRVKHYRTTEMNWMIICEISKSLWKVQVDIQAPVYLIPYSAWVTHIWYHLLIEEDMKERKHVWALSVCGKWGRRGNNRKQLFSILYFKSLRGW